MHFYGLQPKLTYIYVCYAIIYECNYYFLLLQGYEQELQLREVSRSKLQRKGIQLMASKPRLTDDVSIKLESLNQQWHALQQHIAPSPLLARKANSSR